MMSLCCCEAQLQPHRPVLNVCPISRRVPLASQPDDVWTTLRDTMAPDEHPYHPSEARGDPRTSGRLSGS